MKAALGRAIASRFGLLVPAHMDELRTEQSKALGIASWVFAALGLNTTAMILVDFWSKFGSYGCALALSIMALYAIWVAMALRSAGSAIFMRASTALLVLQGSLWALMINELVAIAAPEQRNFVTALLMALISTPMLASPFSVAMAFWLPTAVGGMLAIESIRPADDYMPACFAGYIGFTFVCILVLNRTLLERSVVRTRLRRQNCTVRLLLKDYEENAADWLWETDEMMRLREVTPRFAQVLCTSRQHASGLELNDALGLRGSTEAGEVALTGAVSMREPFRDLSLRVCVAGHIRWWSLTGRPVVSAAGKFDGYRGVGSDTTEARHADEMTRHLATHDSLTGLGNRRMFLDEMDIACGEAGDARPANERRPFALLMVDLDRFKEVNDDYGHEAGDIVLTTVSQRIRTLLRDSDIVARLGGDEFAMLLRSAGEMDAVAIAQRLIRIIEEPVRVEETWLVVGASVGVALFPRDGRTSKEIMRSADLALYRAKDADRGTHRVFDPAFGEEFQDRLALLADLRTAMSRGELSLHYQPIFDIATGRIVSMEALCRWTHSTRGSVPPSTFIPLAEENGLISALGRDVLAEACRAARLWEPGTSVSVNLSPIQFRDPVLPETISAVLRTTGLPPSRLELEVTESAWLGGNNQTTHQLSQLEALGVKIVMDDFGTGFSSLSSLRAFKFHGLKIDADFIRDVENDTKASAIVRLVAGLAGELGITLTAEGIESEGQLAIVRELGAARAQGYLLGRPAPDSCKKVNEIRPEVERANTDDVPSQMAAQFSV